MDNQPPLSFYHDYGSHAHVHPSLLHDDACAYAYSEVPTACLHYWKQSFAFSLISLSFLASYGLKIESA
jgi:hypothetical protein